MSNDHDERQALLEATIKEIEALCGSRRHPPRLLLARDRLDEQTDGATNAEAVLALWRQIPESGRWGEVTQILRARERPSIVLLSGRGELYAALDMRQGRVLTSDEFPPSFVALFDWTALLDLEERELQQKRERRALRAAALAAALGPKPRNRAERRARERKRKELAAVGVA